MYDDWKLGILSMAHPKSIRRLVFCPIHNPRTQRFFSLHCLFSRNTPIIMPSQTFATAVGGQHVDLKQFAKPLRLNDPGKDYNELLDAIGNARIVCIGDGSHGTLEFYVSFSFSGICHSQGSRAEKFGNSVSGHTLLSDSLPRKVCRLHISAG